MFHYFHAFCDAVLFRGIYSVAFHAVFHFLFYLCMKSGYNRNETAMQNPLPEKFISGTDVFSKRAIMKNEPNLPLIKEDDWLLPVKDRIQARHDRYQNVLDDITAHCGSIVNYANGYFYFGLHFNPEANGWYFREWLPGASDVYLFGDFNDWQRTELPLKKDKNGVWTLFLDREKWEDRLVHKSKYKILVHGENGWYERLPAYTFRAVEDPETHNYSAQIWAPEKPYRFKTKTFDPYADGALLIYEAHIGMAQEKEGIGTYTEFTRNILPRIREMGYNTLQLMAIAEHPYYGSFGYHVSNFFAPSSRFGTPDELKALIDRAHELGIGVIMDLVHAHYVKNFNEGLNELDGTDHLYSKAGEEGYQPFWDSKTFDYGKPEVRHFLLSNIKYWMEEFHFDGFRFDGVTSMLYRHHGHIEFFGRDDFFNDQVDEEALCYLTLANTLIHALNPHAVSIAEDVSGMPGLCYPAEGGGAGFDYRLGMSVPDFWIKQIQDRPDDEWNMQEMWDQMTNRLPYCKTVAYAESHDQALVGDKTIAFRLMDKEMYDKMNKASRSIVIDRGIALHKMIRLFTLATASNAYLNFMGNEFGHPEWIDFPREGNGFSYSHACRKWSLASDVFSRYIFLQRFDQAMIALEKKYSILDGEYPYLLSIDEANKTIVFEHAALIFVFNWHPARSIPDYRIPVREPGKYRLCLNSDDEKFGGFNRIDSRTEYFSKNGKDERPYLYIYNINRAALVFEKID